MNLRRLLFAFAALFLGATLFIHPAPAQLDLDFGKKEPPLTASLVADTKAIEAGKPFLLGVKIKLAEGWHTYWRYAGNTGQATQVIWNLPEGFKPGELQWPIPESHYFLDMFQQYGYEGELLLWAQVTPPATLPAGEIKLAATLDWMACKDTCIPDKTPMELPLPAGKAEADNEELFAKYRAQLPHEDKPPFTLTWKVAAKGVALDLTGVPKDTAVEFMPLPDPSGLEIKVDKPRISTPAEDGSRRITQPLTKDSEGTNTWRGVLVTKKPDGTREGWLVADPNPTAQKLTALPSDPPPAPAGGLLGVLGAALLGGLILNIMPCVLPVIALKIFGFMNQANENPRRIFHLGLAFTAGVFAFFLLLAGVAIALRQGGGSLAWGSQFQNPRILAALIAAVFVFALSMIGVFEITLGSGTATQLDSLAHKEGLGGAFMHGLFTTLLGTSCTAPFLGGALGFAVVQPPPIIILVFLTVAAGMSMPYLLLTWKPAWIKYLPKPGVWMERVKQVLGFGMLAVVVWLYTVFIGANGADVGGSLGWMLLALGLGAWILGTFRRSIVTWLVVLALIGGTYFVTLGGSLAKDGIEWKPWSKEAIDDALADGHGVFVDFTAAWCLNCKANERFAIDTAPVRKAIQEKGIVTLKADFTKEDPQIKDELQKYGRSGVPLYLYFAKAGVDPVVFPEAITRGMLLEAFAKTSADKPAE